MIDYSVYSPAEPHCEHVRLSHRLRSSALELEWLGTKQFTPYSLTLMAGSTVLHRDWRWLAKMGLGGIVAAGAEKLDECEGCYEQEAELHKGCNRPILITLTMSLTLLPRRAELHRPSRYSPSLLVSVVYSAASWQTAREGERALLWILGSLAGYFARVEMDEDEGSRCAHEENPRY
jgi:hypothetical protein